MIKFVEDFIFCQPPYIIKLARDKTGCTLSHSKFMLIQKQMFQFLEGYLNHYITLATNEHY